MSARIILALYCLARISAGAGPLFEQKLSAAGENQTEIRAFVDAAAGDHGSFGEKAAMFLVEGMRDNDLKSLGKDFLLENLSLALQAREKFPWAQKVPDEVFLNDVLPYASLDETREAWRKDFYDQCGPLVADCTTATEAAQTLNKDLFKLIKVHYNTGRKAPNQSPAESKKLGMATCTGLAIILVDACRAVGVPARVAGTPLWSNKRGNHTWVEIHDSGQWSFTGADEYNKDGLNKAWFTGDASKAIADDWRHAIWASSWKPTGSHFPMVWNLDDRSVAAANVTIRYTTKPPVATTGAQRRWTKSTTNSSKNTDTTVHLRAWDRSGGQRLALTVDVMDAAGNKLRTVTTRAGTTDLNDMPTVKLPLDQTYRLLIGNGTEQRAMPLRLEQAGETTIDLLWNDLKKQDPTPQAVKDRLALPSS